ncbi:DegT/DnrJ/EryC1/StrS family aminotransferase [Sulfurimonas sp. HSL-3221]|uniref:DegT/DnrJ/EryC1/StrS family aminotransferase n=1 Tax=Thiomicrolovo sulfuroxydans TaxID=2894755 RepID=UPI001E471B29|nr:DegT/DnrJ/EryC1/StrS family aminotransferase [Sulfurimonas sp. HSL-3221]UFS62894.1 DegT/DnrJ/EryC1/StrS family aminotransferase [Sulfurimonas sp. HSL-3221]
MSASGGTSAPIPFSARARERDALATRTFALDPDAPDRLESAVAAYHGCAHAIAFDTPSSALEALLAPLKEATIITDAMAPPHRSGALCRSGVRTRYADIGLDGVLMAAAVEKAVGTETDAVLFAHFGGIRSTSLEIPTTRTLLEDATGSLLPMKPSGSAVWTLAPLMPDGVSSTGFLLTDDDATAQNARLFRRGGRQPGTLWNYDLPLRGADCTLDLLAATVALEQLQHLEAACERRRENSALLDEHLRSTLFDCMKRTPDDAPASYPILLTPQLYCPKEDIYSSIRGEGIEATVCCKPLYKTTAFKDEGVRLPITEDFYKALLQLPCHHKLSVDEVKLVAAAVREATEKYAYRGCSF